MTLHMRNVPLTLALSLAGVLMVDDALADMKGKRPTVGPPDACIGYDCEGGIICSCCYDDGCWICDAGKPGGFPGDPNWRTCEWEQASRRSGVTKVRPGTDGILDPGTPPTTKPYNLPGGGGTLSK